MLFNFDKKKKIEESKEFTNAIPYKSEEEFKLEQEKYTQECIEAGNKFIEFYYRQIINLPEPLLDVLRDLMKDYEEQRNQGNNPILSNEYIVTPWIGNNRVWVSFTHNDILWWRKALKEKIPGGFYLKSLKEIENDFNILYLYILEIYQPDLVHKFPEVEEFYRNLLEFVENNLNCEL